MKCLCEMHSSVKFKHVLNESNTSEYFPVNETNQPSNASLVASSIARYAENCLSQIMIHHIIQMKYVNLALCKTAFTDVKLVSSLTTQLSVINKSMFRAFRLQITRLDTLQLFQCMHNLKQELRITKINLYAYVINLV